LIALQILILVGLVLVNAIFSAAGSALLAMRKSRLRELVAQGKDAARAVQSLRHDPERLMATVQIGVTLAGATMATLSTSWLAWRIQEWLEYFHLGHGAATYLALAVVILGVTYATIVLGELVPRSLALRAAEGYALSTGRPFAALAVLLKPVVWLLTASSNVVLRVFGDRTTFAEARLHPDELQQLVEESARAGALDARIGDIASRCFDFADLTVQAVMLPRHRIVALRRHAKSDEVLRVVIEEGHSRFPVYDGSLDTVVGYIISRDVLALAHEPQLLVLEDLLRPAYFVTEKTPAVSALKELQRRRVQMAIVQDDHSATAGLVTIEDLVEELVGDIFSESEVPEVLVQREPDGAAIVQGAAPIREVNRELGLELPEGEGWSTMAGLCTHLAGLIPAPGARVNVPIEPPVTLEILEASPSRVRTLRVRRA
jgi:putative hemolysin